jgi:membrane-associated phospholipid phosphatase
VRYFLLFFFILLQQFSNAQSDRIYNLNKTNELGWVCGSVAGLGFDRFLLMPRNKAFSPTDIAALNIGSIPRFDRVSTRLYNSKAKKWSDIVLFSAPVLASSLMLSPRIRGHAQVEGLILLETALFSTALVSITKDLVRRPRPLCFNPDVPLAVKLKTDAKQSYYSGHTSLTTATCIAAAAMWSQYHPNSPWKPVVWTGAVALPVTIALLRVKAGKHYPSDVLSGLLIGAAAGVAVPAWHRR